MGIKDWIDTFSLKRLPWLSLVGSVVGLFLVGAWIFDLPSVTASIAGFAVVLGLPAASTAQFFMSVHDWMVDPIRIEVIWWVAIVVLALSVWRYCDGFGLRLYWLNRRRELAQKVRYARDGLSDSRAGRDDPTRHQVLRAAERDYWKAREDEIVDDFAATLTMERSSGAFVILAAVAFELNRWIMPWAGWFIAMVLLGVVVVCFRERSHDSSAPGTFGMIGLQLLLLGMSGLIAVVRAPLYALSLLLDPSSTTVRESEQVRRRTEALRAMPDYVGPSAAD